MVKKDEKPTTKAQYVVECSYVKVYTAGGEVCIERGEVTDLISPKTAAVLLKQGKIAVATDTKDEGEG